VAIVLIYLLTAFVLSRITIDEERLAPDELEIYLVTNGVHSDIVVPTITQEINWFSNLPFLNSNIDTSIYKYIAFGWGDKGFYLNTPTWSDLTLSTTLKACVGISGSAIHATYYKQMTESEFCKRILISKEQYGLLIKYIQNSFDRNEFGELIRIVNIANSGSLNAFYEARGRYNIFNTCNTWTNRGLKFCGQKACLWTAFQKPIFMKYEVKPN